MYLTSTDDSDYERPAAAGDGLISDGRLRTIEQMKILRVKSRN